MRTALIVLLFSSTAAQAQNFQQAPPVILVPFTENERKGAPPLTDDQLRQALDNMRKNSPRIETDEERLLRRLRAVEYELDVVKNRLEELEYRERLRGRF